MDQIQMSRRLVSALCSLAMVALLLFTVAHLQISPGDQEVARNQYAIQQKQVIGGDGTNRKLLPLQGGCESMCEVRCSVHSRPNLCKRACGTCCFRCKCVPPGTAGNREMCGKCYTDMRTHGNRTKCP